jgi:hypothetical protein
MRMRSGRQQVMRPLSSIWEEGEEEEEDILEEREAEAKKYIDMPPLEDV